MKTYCYAIIILLGIYFSDNLTAHDVNTKSSQINYLGNEGVMVVSGDTKLLFDPFFHNTFGIYTQVPKAIRHAIFQNIEPYNNIDALFISHAHGDHFDANDVLHYLLNNKNVLLIAPQQAIDLLIPLKAFSQIKNRLHAINFQKDDKAVTIKMNQLTIEAIRIPHAGWPERADVQNIIFKVSAKNDFSVMHMGDADPNEAHYQDYQEFFKKITDVAFPPYWFALSVSGRNLMETTLNAKQYIGLHVPADVPSALKASKLDYFSEPGDKRVIKIDDSKPIKRNTKLH